MGPNSKDYSILGSILGSSYFGKLPERGCIGIIDDKMEAIIVGLDSGNGQSQAKTHRSGKACNLCIASDASCAGRLQTNVREDKQRQMDPKP